MSYSFLTPREKNAFDPVSCKETMGYTSSHAEEFRP
jgi:hypothetical protein